MNMIMQPTLAATGVLSTIASCDRGHLARAHQPAAACSSRHVRRWHLAHGGAPELSNPPGTAAPRHPIVRYTPLYV